MALKVCPHSTVPKSDSKILCQQKEEALHSGTEHSIRGWRDGSGLRTLVALPEHLCGSSQPAVTLVPEDLTSPCDLLSHSLHAVDIHTCRQNKHKLRREEILKMQKYVQNGPSERCRPPQSPTVRSRMAASFWCGCRALDSFPDHVGKERMGQKLSVKRDLRTAVTSSWASP